MSIEKSDNPGMSYSLPPTERRELLKNALQALDETQARLDAVEQARSEPIAIVGMSCRFPGGAKTPEEYWQLLCDGVDAIGPVSDARRELIGEMGRQTDWSLVNGGFLEDVDGFDPQFFGMSPREAASLDPQQRLVLEISWEALERAGIAPDRLSGSLTGVFLGISTTDYGRLMARHVDGLDVYAATGGALNAAPGRISYTLGLSGPAIAVDTACSSSLVAIHLAAQSLRGGECDMAITGGVNLALLPDAFSCFTQWGMLAANARCKAFDASADGFVRAEGCGMVILKRLSDARSAGDNILAVVRGSAVNQDGRSAGLTVPSGTAQRAVIQAALKNANLKPHQIQYLEAHGTGTSLGDPIEVEAIGDALRPGRSSEHPLFLGSVKTNLGHLESAAGIAGLIKIVKMFEHGQVPPHLHLQERNPNIPWPDFPIEIPTTMADWPDNGSPRLAGVSGFGLSGTNAHVILEQAPQPESAHAPLERPRHPIVLSARDESALTELAGRYADRLRSQMQLSPGDVAASASQGRAHLPHRLAINVASTDEAAAKLAAFADGKPQPGIVSGVVPVASRVRPVFLFTGQGSQYAGMGRDLYDSAPVFRDTINRCAGLLAPQLPHGLLDVMFAEPRSPEAELLNRTEYTQPALFAFEYALATLWQSWGVRPAALAGHSLGEYVAACVAGVFSLEDALRLVAARGRLMGELPHGGAMAAIFADVETVRAALAQQPNCLSIAAVNGPQHTVISGAADAVRSVSDVLESAGHRVRALVVSHAFHSPLMDPVLDAFEALAATVAYKSPDIPLVANLTGEFWPRGSAPDATYWRAHLREGVQFAGSIQTLHDAEYDCYLEIGPHPVLTGMGQECVPAGSGTWLPSMRRDHDAWESMFTSLGRLYVAGANIDWSGVTAEYGNARVDLPTYPFQRQHYWTAAAKLRLGQIDTSQHTLLGRRTRSPLLPATLYESTVSEERPAYLGEHRIYGTAIFPGSAFIEMALAAAADTGEGIYSLDHLELQAPLVLPPDGSERVLQMALTPQEQGPFAFQIASMSVQSSDLTDATTHAAGTVRVSQPTALPDVLDPQLFTAALPETIDIGPYYTRLAEAGLNYGTMFKGLSSMQRGEGAAIGFVRLPESGNDDGSYLIHPAQLDACFHVVGGAVPDSLQNEGTPYVPMEVHGLRLFRKAPAELWCTAEIVDAGDLPSGSLAAHLRLYAADGSPVAEMEQLVIRRVPKGAWSRVITAGSRDWFYQQTWLPATPEPVSVEAGAGAWLVITDQMSNANGLASELIAHGASNVTVIAGTNGSPQADQDLLDLHDPLAMKSLIHSMHQEQPLQGILYLVDTDDQENTGVGASLPGALHLAQALAELPEEPPRLWLTTRGAVAVNGELTPLQPAAAALWGFGRTLAVETPALATTCLDLDPLVPFDPRRVAELLLGSSDENQIALRGSRTFISRLERHVQPATLPAGPYGLHFAERGTLERLTIASVERQEPGPGEIEVAVRATGLNFRDVLNVLGMYPGDPGPPGVESAGIVTAVGDGVEHLQVGDDVIALGIGHFASHAIVKANLAFPKPAALSFAEAASIPSAYLAAAYGLLNLANLQQGERVLIHAATGGVGLAAVYIAMSRGAQVYATVGSPAKRDFLTQLGVQHIYSSRTLGFADEILSDTGGDGVDVILNSLADDFIDRSFAVLAPNGRFLELGKRGIWTDEQVAEVRPAASYHVYDLGYILLHQPGVLEELLRELLDDIVQGTLPLVPVRSFPASATAEAFRYMAQARHIGKIVVSHRPEESRSIRPDGSYLVTGGMGGLGLETARWLVEHGARAIALLGRSEPGAAALQCIAELQDAGARVLALRGNVSNTDDITEALSAIGRELPPLRGIFHAAGTIDDGALEQQSWSRIAGVLDAKANGALQLHHQTLQYDLDHFVLYSSASAVLGSPGQIGYTAANAVLDTLAHERWSSGRPALSINWGAWERVGMAAGLGEAHQRRLAERGMGSIAPERGFSALTTAIGFDSPQLVIMPVQWDKVAQQFEAGHAPAFIRDLLAAAPAASRIAAVPIAERLAAADEQAIPEIIHDYIRESVAAVLGLSAAQINPNQPLPELGLDSLMAVEVRNSVGSALQIVLSPADVLDGASVAELAERVLALMITSSESTLPGHVLVDLDAEAVEAAELLAGIDQLSDSDVEELLDLIGSGGPAR